MGAARRWQMPGPPRCCVALPPSLGCFFLLSHSISFHVESRLQTKAAGGQGGERCLGVWEREKPKAEEQRRQSRQQTGCTLIFESVEALQCHVIIQ